ncbi:MAG: hypothetical protein MZV63_34250 [Marinilabiliales bacterium]|nr:hypothetical protein [Marinilabiliales bacterium]
MTTDGTVDQGGPGAAAGRRGNTGRAHRSADHCRAGVPARQLEPSGAVTQALTFP